MMRLVSGKVCGFSIRKTILDTLYLGDPSSRAERIARGSINLKLEGVEEYEVSPQPYTYKSTKLSSGLTVLTQSVSTPSNVHMGVFLDIGTRDQTPETSGSMLSIKNTYLKTAINTSETVNYCIVQMAGGEFEMDFNRENAFYRVNCLSHDVIDVFSMLADCAFEPKNFVAASVGRNKNENSHKLDAYNGGNQTFNDHIYNAAFGRSGLGSPLYGSRSNVGNLTGYILQKFQGKTLATNKAVVVASGIENHDQFVELVSEKMFFTQLSGKGAEREQASYVGGEVRNLTDSSSASVALVFGGSSYGQSLPLLLATQILGNGRRSGRIQRNILNKHAFVKDAEAFNANYSDSGLFGLKVSGSANYVHDIVGVVARELSSLREVTAKQVEIAKQTLKSKLAREYSSSWKRLEDQTKSLYYLGRTNESWTSAIDAVSVSDVQSAVSASLKTPLTLVAQGGEVQRIASYDKVSKLLN